MTIVLCAYCGLKVVAGPAPAGSPLPCYRDGLLDPEGVALGVRSGPHSCTGLDYAARIYGHAQAEARP